MSSSRDHIILTGTPGIALAIATPCRTKSCVVPRRPKPPPSIILCTSTFSGGRPAASAAASSEASPFCVDVHTSSKPSGLNHAVQVCGSSVAWLKYGDWYSASTILDAAANPACTSPSLRACGRFASRSPSRSIAAIDRLSDPALPAASQSIFTFFKASFARHQLSATTATKLSSRTTFFTPRMASAARASTPATLPPNTGHCAIDACSIPGSATSTANTGLPRTLSGRSSRCSGLPAIFHWAGSRNVTSLGGASLAAAPATSP